MIIEYDIKTTIEDKMTEPKTKSVDGYRLEYSCSCVTIHTNCRAVGHVWKCLDEYLVDLLHGFRANSTAITNAIDYLRECLAVEKAEAERAAMEALSKFTIDETYEFVMKGRGVAVYLRGISQGYVTDSFSPPILRGDVVAAARRFAGWT